MIFKDFLLNENKVLLYQRVGDILNALQDLSENFKGLGRRRSTDAAKNIVNAIRSSILQYNKWPNSEINNIRKIQSCAFAIMKSVEESIEDNDLEIVINKCIKILQKMVSESETPINNL
jgi:hypothetical protein